MTVKLQESKGRYTVTIPAKLVEAMDWNKGDELKVRIENGSLLFEK